MAQILENKDTSKDTALAFVTATAATEAAVTGVSALRQQMGNVLGNAYTCLNTLPGWKSQMINAGCSVLGLVGFNLLDNNVE